MNCHKVCGVFDVQEDEWLLWLLPGDVSVFYSVWRVDKIWIELYETNPVALNPLWIVSGK